MPLPAQGPPDILWIASGHSREVNAVSYSPDGTLIATASDDFTIKLWRAADGAFVRTLTGHRQDVQSAAFTPDGTLLVSGGKDDTIRVWRVADGTQVQLFEEGAATGWDRIEPRHSLVLSPDGSLVVTARTFSHISETNRLGVIQVRRLADGRRVREILRPGKHIFGLAYSPDGNWLAAGENPGAALWKTSDWTLTPAFQEITNAVEAIAFSHDSKMLAGAGMIEGAGVVISLWQVPDGALVRHLTGIRSWVRSIAFSPNGDLLAAAAWNRRLHAWRVTETNPLWVVRGGDSFRAVAFSPDGDYVVAGNKDDSVTIHRADTGAQVRRLTAHTEPVVVTAFSPDETMVASGACGGDDISTRLWNAGDGSLVWHQPGVCGPLAISPDGSLLAMAPWTDPNRVSIYSLPGGQLVTSIQQGQTTSLAFTPDGTQLVTGGYDSNIRFRRLPDLELIRTLSCGNGAVTPLEFSPDGQFLACGAGDASARLWRNADGAEVGSIPGRLFSADPSGTMVALSQQQQNRLLLWRWADPRPLRTIVGLFDVRSYVAFTPDWQYVVSAGDGTLRYWGVTDDALVRTYDQDVVDIRSFAFSLSGRFMAYGREDGSVVMARNEYGVVDPGIGLPQVVVQPQTQTAIADAKVALWVRVTGASPFSFQWRRNGEPVAGGTNRALILDKAADALAGQYDVVVANSSGAVTSLVATLTVSRPPVIAEHPQSQTVALGADATLIVLPSPGEGASYQWRLRDQDIPGATNYTLLIEAADATDSGSYSVLASKSTGAISSRPATLTVQVPAAPMWIKGYHATQPRCVAYSTDGRSLLSSSVEMVNLWRMPEGELARSFPRRSPWDCPAAMSPDGGVVAVATGKDATLIELRGSDGAFLRTLTNDNHVVCMAFTPDGKTLVAGDLGRDAKFWNVADGKLVMQVDLPYQIVSITVSPDGTLFGANFHEVIGIYRMSDLSIVRTLYVDDNPAWSLAFSPDSSLLAAATAGPRLIVWTALSGVRRFKAIVAGSADAHSVAFSPNGSMLATAAGSFPHVQLWSAATGQAIMSLGQQSPNNGTGAVVFSPDGGTIVASGEGSRLQVWRVSDSAIERSLAAAVDPVNAMTLSAGGETVAVGSGIQGIRILRAADGAVMSTVPFARDPALRLALSPDGSLLASISSPAEPVYVWRTSDGTLLHSLDHGGTPMLAMAFSPDGQTLAAAISPAIWLWGLEPLGLRWLETRATMPTGLLAYSRDGALLACDAPDGGVQVLRMDTFARVLTLPPPGSGPCQAAFSPDGKLLAVGCSDTHIRLWRVPEGDLVNNLAGNTAPVTSLAFSPGGRILAATTADGQLQFWRLDDGTLLSIGLPDVLGARMLAVSARTGRIAIVSGLDTVSVGPDPFLFIEGIARLDPVTPWRAGPFEMVLTGSKHRRYSVESSPDLLNWLEWTNFIATSPCTRVGDPDAARNKNRFYRAVER